MTIGQTDRGAELITSTGIVTHPGYSSDNYQVLSDLVKMKFDQEMRFDWNTHFSMDYGTSPFSGLMHVICEKPSYHEILCRYVLIGIA